MRLLFASLLLLGLSLNVAAAEFELAAPQGAASILVPASEPECLRLAAADLAGDVEKITSQKPAIIDTFEACKPQAVILVSADQPASAKLLDRLGVKPASVAGKWEAYRVRLIETSAGPLKQAILIEGSDPRGTMFGLYAFIEQYLKVDPLYFWAGRPPKPRPCLAWDTVDITVGEPTFRYRGWFVNDEDLLTEWLGSGGKRNIDYPYYHQVMSPKVSARVFEAMLRLQYNLVIPSSFVDIRNPAEARLIDDATRRGLLVTQHHIEPLGVSGFGFMNYWKEKGEEVPFSFIRHRDKFETTWREYAGRWAKYPGVVWQLGLRGIADRPLWVTDPAAPKTDEARGRLISDAMALQWEIVKSVDKRTQPPATTTLWMEGADLHNKGHLTFPPNVAVIFADNSPGWEWQQDFFKVVRQPGRPYGVYYHHGLWGQGPHLIQGPSPERTYGLFKLVVERQSNHYAILNVGNVREFVLGLDATGRLLRDFNGYDPDRFLKRWCEERFGPAADEAMAAYKLYFANFTASTANKGRGLLDGELMGTGKKFYASLLEHAANPKLKWDKPEQIRSRLKEVEAQRAAVEKAGEKIDDVVDKLDGDAKRFFEVNLLAQQKILLGLLKWVESGLRAGLAMQEGDPVIVVAHAVEGQSGIALIRSGQALCARDEWKDWYTGDKKMNITAAEKLSGDLLKALRPK